MLRFTDPGAPGSARASTGSELPVAPWERNSFLGWVLSFARFCVLPASTRRPTLAAARLSQLCKHEVAGPLGLDMGGIILDGKLKLAEGLFVPSQCDVGSR